MRNQIKGYSADIIRCRDQPFIVVPFQEDRPITGRKFSMTLRRTLLPALMAFSPRRSQEPQPGGRVQRSAMSDMLQLVVQIRNTQQ